MSQPSHSETLKSGINFPSGWQWGIEIGLIFLVFFVFGGDPPPHLNEPHYLCRFKHFWEPEWAAGDLFLESPDAHFVAVVTFGWLTNWLSLSATAWTLRIAVWIALAWAWQRLSFRLVPHNWCAPLTAGIWTLAIEQGNLAGEWVIGGFEAKCVAYVFVLLALRDLVDNRWNRAWLLLGCASAFHVLVGGWSVIVSLFVWAILRQGAFARTGWSEAPPPTFFAMLPSLVAGGAISLLGLIPTLTLNWGTPPEIIEEANFIYTFVRLPHHLALLSKGSDWLWERAGCHAIVFAIWVLLVWRLLRCRPTTLHGPLGRMILFAAGALALAACGFAIELALWNYPYTAAKLQRFYWYRLNDITAAAVAAWLIVDWIVELIGKRRPLGVLLLTLVLALVGSRMAYLAYLRSLEALAPADRNTTPFADWVNVCDWIRNNTQPGSLFLTPKHASSFKWRTGRPEVVTYKDIPQDAANMVEWHRRFVDVFRPPIPDFPLHSLGDLGTARVAELARRYLADFVLTDTRRPLGFPIQYENETFVVYDVRAASSAPLSEPIRDGRTN